MAKTTTCDSSVLSFIWIRKGKRAAKRLRIMFISLFLSLYECVCSSTHPHKAETYSCIFCNRHWCYAHDGTSLIDKVCTLEMELLSELQGVKRCQRAHIYVILMNFLPGCDASLLCPVIRLTTVLQFLSKPCCHYTLFWRSSMSLMCSISPRCILQLLRNLVVQSL